MGRQCKLTPETQQKIVNAIAEGNYLETAAALGGISCTTFFRWLQEGEQAAAGAKRDFWEAVKKAEAEAEALRVSRINKAGRDGNWQADAWYLERRYPDRWGKRVQEVTGKDGGPLEYVQRVQELTDSELERIILSRGGARAAE